MSVELNGVEYIYGTNPEREIWYYYLTRVVNPYFVKRVMAGKTTNDVITKLVNSGLQARELYEAYNTSSLLSKPILLLYSFERLAIMLILARKGDMASSKHHGLEYEENKIIVKKMGLFPKFHNYYSTDPSIYMKRNGRSNWRA